MHSSLISKIQKANMYAREPERLCITQFTTTFNGENDSHVVTYQEGRWTCSCDFFQGWGLCSHTMAIEKMLGPMLPKEAKQGIPAAATV